MTLKSKTILSLIISLVFTAGFITLLSVAYMKNFTLPFTLSLLGTVVIAMVSWGFYYLTFSKYKESLDAKKNKYIKKGSRNESRKGVKSRTKSRTRKR